ncbi:hypothetical protein FB45DRAFT_870712 [Roridomyces roridus]|uniref:Uncharacterized protein n=1 Tax=Roridomyces roridus TaxID=1738132 RepID=A0AAD7FGH6_9AGAR|nr:hypothetical protein FB45DRAFT_870712 [Roridomyces roridus]
MRFHLSAVFFTFASMVDASPKHRCPRGHQRGRSEREPPRRRIAVPVDINEDVTIGSEREPPRRRIAVDINEDVTIGSEREPPRRRIAVDINEDVTIGSEREPPR